MINVQLQHRGCDCGLFALALAIALANNLQPEKINFKQDAMRDHLHKCLSAGVLSMFPTDAEVKRGQLRRKKFKASYTIPLHCTCRMPEILPMVECSKCKQWYHNDCVDVSKEALENPNKEWFCVSCTANQ